MGISKKGFLPGFIGESDSMLLLFDLIKRVAKTPATVLIEGESGTGKELIALALHQLSDRSTKPFIRFNSAALSETLIESELFGHEPGAFTGASGLRKGRFELADGGSIFIDEIGELSMNMQVKLLRILQEKEFERVGGSTTIKTNVRIIAATNKSLLRKVQLGEFRDDLYYRLNMFPVFVPPLRVREGDIERLCHYFLKELCNEFNKSILGFSKEALSLLKNYSWPGNVRELQNVMSRAVIMCDTKHIQDNHLFFNAKPSKIDFSEFCAHKILTEEEFVKEYAKFIYDKCGKNKKKTTDLLNINFRTLLSRLK